MNALPRCLLALALAAAAAGGEEGTQPTGLLHADYHVDQPLAPDGTTAVTAHLVNVCPAPVRLAIDELSYQPIFVACFVPAAATTSDLDHSVWGPDVGAPVVIDLAKLRVSGVGAEGQLPRWPKREGVVLLQDEGYARRLTFLPGWADAKALPKDLTGVVITVALPLAMALPKLEPAAVAPGKPVQFAPPAEVYAPGNRLIPFRHAATPPVEPAGEPPPAPPGLRLAIELAEPAEAGRDLEATYLVGNEGPATVWVRQNSLVAPHATWEIERKGAVITTIDGEAIRGLLDLLPEREPLPLNPGEWLSYRRVLLARSLPLKRGETCTLRLRLDAPWHAAAPGAADEPRVAALTAAVALPVK